MSKYIKLTNSDKPAIVDDENYQWLNKYSWRLDDEGYVVTTIDGEDAFMHNMVWQNAKMKKIWQLTKDTVDRLNEDELDQEDYTVFCVSMLMNLLKTVQEDDGLDAVNYFATSFANKLQQAASQAFPLHVDIHVDDPELTEENLRIDRYADALSAKGMPDREVARACCYVKEYGFDAMDSGVPELCSVFKEPTCGDWDCLTPDHQVLVWEKHE